LGVSAWEQSEREQSEREQKRPGGPAKSVACHGDYYTKGGREMP